jgi:hypothetical protein
VEYFAGGSPGDDGEGSEGEEEGAGNTATARTQSAREEEDGLHFRPSYLLGNKPVSAPWMHGEESSNEQWVSSLVAEGEEGVDTDDISDNEQGLAEGDDEEMDSSDEDLLNGSSEEDFYMDYAVPTANSSYGVDLVVDRGSNAGGFDRSMRRGSVNSIVKTLRSAMEENSSNATIERSNAEDFVQKLGPVLLPWEREDEDDEVLGGGKAGRRSNAELAEKTIPEHELRRLRDAALRMKERIKVGSGGVTQDIVESIHKKWKVDEVVKMRFEGPPSLNMKRTHDLLEVPNSMVHVYLQVFSIQFKMNSFFKSCSCQSG